MHGFCRLKHQLNWKQLLHSSQVLVLKILTAVTLKKLVELVIHFIKFWLSILFSMKILDLFAFLNTFLSGIEVSNEEIERTVGEIFEESKTLILEQRYKTNGLYLSSFHYLCFMFIKVEVHFTCSSLIYFSGGFFLVAAYLYHILLFLSSNFLSWMLLSHHIAL